MSCHDLNNGPFRPLDNYSVRRFSCASEKDGEVPPQTTKSANAHRSTNAALGKVLRSLRISREMSQEDLSEVSGYSRNFLSLLERGQKSPSLRTLFDLSDALKAEAADIVIEVERMSHRKGKTT